MKQLLKLISIGLIAGIVLMLILKIVILLTGNTAYILLFNFDYIPILNALRPEWLFGYVFHFITCIVSVVALYHILKSFKLEERIRPYILVYTIGGGALFFLTALSDQPPAVNDLMAWVYWTFAHAVYGYVVGYLIKKWL
ncbi:hypothetical protein DFQ11_102609 [Winogradskyella epiphytica]|uniref:Uncharacterized protein n=1 Tax=Winogradskyella epiphytica TaxID=262005 RepID=A0A2V4X8S8_9FLAO|nr:hypothetical protein [Winogradskyella epiphytica]PYE82029.1 hypothetical protein DFQ11_102609 [Winogradskyella epiphytica]GGW60975.1 hypothetical protein GCM10008085_10650 [Winogradskyella epiphytica]